MKIYTHLTMFLPKLMVNWSGVECIGMTALCLYKLLVKFYVSSFSDRKRLQQYDGLSHYHVFLCAFGNGWDIC